MSISNAMQSGVSGLLANSTAVRQISFNIANANTDGYRRSFAQMVSNSVTSPGGGQQGAGVRTAIMHLNDADGSFIGTGRATNISINGGGFFVVTRTTMAAACSAVIGGIGFSRRDGAIIGVFTSGMWMAANPPRSTR